MAKKEKSSKAKTKGRRKKPSPITGSPVTIGGGGGKKDYEYAYILFEDSDWVYTPGMLTRKDGADSIGTVQLSLPVSGPIKLPKLGYNEIVVKFE